MRSAALALLVASATAQHTSEIVAPGSVGFGGGSAPRASASNWASNGPPMGYFVSGSSIADLNGVYGPRQTDALDAYLQPALAAYAHDSGNGWVLAHAITADGAQEWVFVDPAGRDRLGHPDATVLGAGTSWRHLHRAPRGGANPGDLPKTAVAPLDALVQPDADDQLPRRIGPLPDAVLFEQILAQYRRQAEAEARERGRQFPPTPPGTSEEEEPPGGEEGAEEEGDGAEGDGEEGAEEEGDGEEAVEEEAVGDEGEPNHHEEDSSTRDAETSADDAVVAPETCEEAAGGLAALRAAVEACGRGSWAVLAVRFGEAAGSAVGWDAARAYLQLARCLRRAQRLASSEAALDAALRLFPRYRAALEERGRLLLDAARPTEALAAFEALLSLAPEQPGLLAWLVRATAASRRAAPRPSASLAGCEAVHVGRNLGAEKRVRQHAQNCTRYQWPMRAIPPL